jgi:diphthamide synthase (EF-2-diphthine--ammonia ligase)
MKTSTLLSWSGGKDAAWTLATLRNDPAREVVGLVTTVTSGYDRIAMHGIRRDLLHAQARAAGVPVIEATIPQQCDNATYEAHSQRRWTKRAIAGRGSAKSRSVICSSKT